MVSDVVGIPQSQLKLSRVQSVPVVLTKGDDMRTLHQLGFVDGDKVVAESTGTNRYVFFSFKISFFSMLSWHF